MLQCRAALLALGYETEGDCGKWLRLVGSRLAEVGFDDPILLEAAAWKNPKEVIDAVFPLNDCVFTETGAAQLDDLLGKIKVMAGWARLASRAPGSEALEDALHTFKKEKDVGRKRAQETEVSKEWSVSTSGGTRGGVSWRPRPLKVRRAGMGTLAEQDDEKASIWTRVLVQIFKDAGVPAWEAAQETADPEAVLAGVVGKARPSTLRKRVRVWQTFCRWLWLHRDARWPRGAADLVDYLYEQFHAPCGRTFPTSFGAAVNWVELRAGIAPEERLGQQGLFRKNLEYVENALASDAAPERKAPRFLVVMIAALELYVINEDIPKVLRIFGWMRLLKVYGTLRWDDLRRLRPENVRLTDGGLSAKLTQTKTSGTNKKVKILPLFIARGASFMNVEWLGVGHALWVKFGDPNRDYFFMRPSPDLESFEIGPATSGDAASLGLKVLYELRVPALGEEDKVWHTGEQPLLGEVLARGWTGHSERSTLPSILAALGVKKSERDFLGRWSAEGSNDYTRTYRTMVKNLTRKLMDSTQQGDVYDRLDEEDALHDVAGILKAKGYSDACISAEVEEHEGPIKNFYEQWCVWGGLAADKDKVKEDSKETVISEVLPDEVKEDEAKFLIALVKRGTITRLHKRHGCWRTRDLVFESYEWVDQDPVPPEMYTAYCRDCFANEVPETPLDLKILADLGNEDIAEEDSESSSD